MKTPDEEMKTTSKSRISQTQQTLYKNIKPHTAKAVHGTKSFLIDRTVVINTTFNAKRFIINLR